MPAEQLPTGTVIVHPPASASEGGAALYARVSRAEQKADLDRQVARLSEFAATKQLRVIADAILSDYTSSPSISFTYIGSCGRDRRV